MCPENVKNMFGKCSGDGGIRGHVQRRGGTRPKVWGEGFDVRPPVRQGMDVQGNPPNSHRAMVTASPQSVPHPRPFRTSSEQFHPFPKPTPMLQTFSTLSEARITAGRGIFEPCPEHSPNACCTCSVNGPSMSPHKSLWHLKKTWHQRKRTDLSPCCIGWRRMGWCGDVGVLRRTRFADFW